MSGTYYFEELPLAMIVAAEKKIEKLLVEDELKLACKCSPVPAYTTLNLKKGGKLYVARERKYNGVDYDYTVQLLDEDLTVLASARYRDCRKGDFGESLHSKYVRPDGYPIEPLFDIAVKALRIAL